MSTQYLQFSSAPSQTCTPKLFALGGDAVLHTGSAVTDSPAGSGLYRSAFTEIAALDGTFRCVVFVGSVGVAGYEAKFTGVDLETAQGAEFTNAGGSGGITVVLPASGTVPKRTQGETIEVFNQEQITLAVAVFDLNKNPVDLSSTSLWFGVWDRSRDQLFEATPTGTATGFTVGIPKVDQVGSGLSWAVRDSSASGQVILTGPFKIVSRPFSA
tara:strand:- start:6375 stop:7016 length:642 start_codon:yes stop_codon:yes gene_type:complete